MFEAEIVRGALADADIPAWLADAEIATSAWLMSVAVGGVKVRVARDRAADADAVLNAASPTPDFEPPTAAEVAAWRAFAAALVGFGSPPFILWAGYQVGRDGRRRGGPSVEPNGVRRARRRGGAGHVSAPARDRLEVVRAGATVADLMAAPRRRGVPSGSRPRAAAGARPDPMHTDGARTWPLSLLALLLAADACFVGLGVLHLTGHAGDAGFSIGEERSYSEIYQYVKYFWVAAVLGAFWAGQRRALYGVLAALFGYLLADEALMIHEFAARPLLSGDELFLGLRMQDYGELLVSAVVGAAFLAVGAWAYRRGDALARGVGRYVAGGVLVLAAFGVGLDAVHQLVGGWLPWADAPLLILEEGGEMVTVSAVVWFVHSAGDAVLGWPRLRSPLAAP